MINTVRAISNETIIVNDEWLSVSFQYKDLIRYSLYWGENKKTLDIWEPEKKAGHIDFEGTEEEYNEWIKPLVDLWQAEKDRLQAEEDAAQAEYETYENRRVRAYDLVNKNYTNIIKNGYVTSSLKYNVGIDTNNLSSLMASKMLFDNDAVETVDILDYNNLNREIDKVQNEQLIKEIAQTQSHIKMQRKDFYNLINETTDNASLNTALSQCVFTTLDFSNGIATTEIEGKTQPSQVPLEQINILDVIDNRKYVI